MTDSDTPIENTDNNDTATGDETPKLFRSVVVQPKMLAIGEWKNVRKRVGTKKVKQVTGILKKEEVEVEQPVFEIEREWVQTGRVSGYSVTDGVIILGKRR